MPKENQCKTCNRAFDSSKALSDHRRKAHSARYYSLRIIPVATTLIIVTLVFLNMFQSTPTNPDGALSNPSSAVDFALPIVTKDGLSGKTLSLSSQKGNTALLEFMVSWCAHCQNMAPTVMQLYENYYDRVSFISVAGTYGGASVESTAKFIRDYNSTWTHVMDNDGKVFHNYGVDVTPTYIILGKERNITARFSGEISSNILATSLDRALGR